MQYEPLGTIKTLSEVIHGFSQCVHGRRFLHLHGNVIAEMTQHGELWINDAGWQTVTTKERLNGFNMVDIVQKDFEWYLNGELWDGSLIKVEW
jgi:hypothetical protein